MKKSGQVWVRGDCGLYGEILDEDGRGYVRSSEFKEGINALDAKIGALDNRIGGLDTRMGGLDTRMGGLDTRMGGLDTRMGGLEHRTDTLEDKIDRVDNKTDKIAAELVRTQGQMGMMEERILNKLGEITDQLAETRDFVTKKIETYDRESISIPQTLDAHGKEIKNLNGHVTNLEAKIPPKKQ